jgi:protein TonB
MMMMFAYLLAAVTNLAFHDEPPRIIAVPDHPPAPGQIVVQPQMMISNSPAASPPVAVGPSRPPGPIPPPVQFHNVTQPQPRAPAQSYVTRDDYPPAALAAKQQGWVRMLLIVGPDGRVGGCLVTRSSGSAALDVTSCNLLRRRARFIPARDSNGNPAAGPLQQEVVWILP